MPIAFDNSYAQLPETFFQRQSPVAVRAPELVAWNAELAHELGLSELSPGDKVDWFSGNTVPPGAEPLAQAYAGHQFGHFVPQLGDGRALLLGEVIDSHGQRRDIQLKGSGRTPYSRGGDGRAPIGPVIREYLVSEAMHALGVPTTRALAAVTTGEPVFRLGAEPGAVLTRVAARHVRVGTFQFFAARGDTDAVQQLIDYTIDRHFPDIREQEELPEERTMALLTAACRQQAALMAHWMRLGFVHGVMNTDNTTLSGETIDFGPCAFLEAYYPDTVFSSIDEGGRYAYGRQPAIAQWNLARLAEALLTTMDDPDAWVPRAQDILQGYREQYEAAWLNAMREKLGLVENEQQADDDRALVESLLAMMADYKADFTLTFRRMADVLDGQSGVTELFPSSKGVPVDTMVADEWLARWRRRVSLETADVTEIAKRMRSVNPAVIPRNHQVQKAIAQAEEGDFAQFKTLLAAVTNPFSEHPEFGQPAQPDEQVLRTFCGT